MPVKWEYKVVEFILDRDTPEIPALAPSGADGWEAVSMFGRVESNSDMPMPLTGHRESERTVLVVLLKRPLVEPDPPASRIVDDDDDVEPLYGGDFS
jgi:hypothetical protein